MNEKKYHMRACIAFTLLFALFAGCGKSADKKENDMQEKMPVISERESQSEVSQVTEAEAVSEEGEADGFRPRPGEATLLNFLVTAKEPLGKTMYVWGGGWNEEDTAAGIEARSIGVSPRWEEFAAMQDMSYNYETTRYQIHDGLDCSGYVGWAVYNVFEHEDGQQGYVGKATGMAEDFAARGWGSYTPALEVTDWKPGDIMSMKGHVWISLGMCADGSVLLLHASPPGVLLCGTRLANGEESLAVELAKQCMSICYPEWYAKYPDCARDYFYLTDSAQMRWNRETLDDEEGVLDMDAEELSELLFTEI